MAPLTTEAKTRDVTTYVAFLDTLPVVAKHRKIGVCGYCMGGPYTLLAAAAAPGRVGAGGSFHGGGLVTDKPDSPHLLIGRIKASYYFGIAGSDDQKQPDAKDKLRAAFDFARIPATIEVYQLPAWLVCSRRRRLQQGRGRSRLRRPGHALREGTHLS